MSLLPVNVHHTLCTLGCVDWRCTNVTSVFMTREIANRNTDSTISLQVLYTVGLHIGTTIFLIILPRK